MSKRITLTDKECEYIIASLKSLKDEINVGYMTVKIGKNVLQDIIDKLSPEKKETTNV